MFRTQRFPFVLLAMCAFVSAAHSDADIERTIAAARRVMTALLD